MADPIKVHKITIRNKPEADGQITSGSNVQVLMDGKPLKGVSFFKFELKPRGIAKVVLEMYADVEIDANVGLTHKAMEPTDLTVNRDGNLKSVALYQLGSYQPKDIATQLGQKADNRDNIGTKPAESGQSCDTGPKPYCGSCGCGKKEAYESKQRETASRSED